MEALPQGVSQIVYRYIHTYFLERTLKEAYAVSRSGVPYLKIATLPKNSRLISETRFVIVNGHDYTLRAYHMHSVDWYPLIGIPTWYKQNICESELKIIV